MIKTLMNFDPSIDMDEEVNNNPSLTKPDMTYTPKELLHRYQQGLPMTKLSNHFYSGDMVAPDLRTLDLTEQAEWIANAKATVQSLDAQLSAKAKQRQKAAADSAKNRKLREDAVIKAADFLAKQQATTAA